MNIHTREFTNTLDSLQLINMVDCPTSSTGHILDLIITDTNNQIIRNIEVENTNTISPIHKLVLFNIEIARKNIQKKKIIFRDKRGLNKESLLEDINTNMLKKDGDPCQHRPQNKRDCSECYSELYYHIAKETYENRCPIVEKEIVIKENAPWFCGVLYTQKEIKGKKREP